MAQSSSAPVGRALVKIALAATAWGTGGVIAAELFATGMGPFAVTFWRFAGGTALLALSTRARPVLARRSALLGVGLAAYQAAYFLGCAWAGVAVATVVTLGAGPVLVAVGARLTGAERLGPAGLGTVLAAVLGLAALVGAGGQAPHPYAGVGAALVSAGGYAVITLHARARPGRPGAEVDLVTFAAGTLALLPIALVDGVLPGGERPVRSWLLLGYLAAVPTVAAYRMYFAALAHVRAGTAAVAVLLEAVVAALLALWLLGERLDLLGWCGMALLLGAVGVRTALESRAYRTAGLGARPDPDYPGVST
jgi:drug/metabolite transporter, DME family